MLQMQCFYNIVNALCGHDDTARMTINVFVINELQR